MFLLYATSVQGQEAPASDFSAREILEASKAEEQLLTEKEQSRARGQQNLSTPLTTLVSLRKAMRNLDHETAAQFLDRRYLPEEMEQYSDKELLNALGYVFNRQNILDLTEVSDHPRGNLNDQLPEYREHIGTVTISSGEIPIYLQRVPDGEGGRVWKLSNATIEQIPAMWDELGYSPVAEYLNRHLPAMKFMGMDNWQLFGTILFFIIAWPLAVLASYILMRIALQVPNRFPLGIQRFFRGPMRIFLYIMFARVLIGQLGLSLTARILLESSGMDFIAWTILLMGLMSLLRDYQIRKMQHAGRTQYVALLKPLTTMAKIIVVTFIALYWAKAAGYDMSTILAGLGVGSLAVALAAQKTLENVIGAVTLYTARPVSAGDFCRFGDITGTVEEIGLRSTLLRTLDRTLLVVPNSVFSSQEIENYSQRDRIRYFHRFRLRLASAEQLRFLLAVVRKTFLAHPQVIQDTVSVRFENIEDANAILRLDAAVDTTDYQEYLAVAEDLNLRIVELVQDAGATFTGPGKFVQLRELEPDSIDHLARVESTVQEWRTQGRLPFPDYGDDDIKAMKDSLDYPPKGSPS